MAAPTPARIAALATLRAVQGGALADRAFDGAARRLDTRDRAWAQELVYGTLRLRGRIDHILSAHSRRPLARLDTETLDILRLGAYQLLEMNGVPGYAAVSQSVELAKRHARSAAGFVNGVLQSLRRAPGPPTFPAFEANPADHLATWGSHPRWLVDRWIARYGAEDARRLVEANNTRPELYVRALGPQPERVRQRLEATGIRTGPVRFPERALRVIEAPAPDVLAAAPVIAQDPAAGMVVQFAGEPPLRVLDLAAAPGGKAIGLAGDRPDPDRLVVAADISMSRLHRLHANIARLEAEPPAGIGTLGIALVRADGRAPSFRAAPMVLIDAPCTGTGTLRRHPDGRWRVQPADLIALARLQAELLDAAAPLVLPGGLLVYATCSLEPEENENQVRNFLDRTPGFAIERGAGPDDVIDDDGMLRVLPQRHGVDGAFAARLRRTA